MGEAQEEASWSESQLLLYGCEMSRMLQDHDGVQPRSDSCAVCGLFNSPVSAHWRQSTSHRGVLIQEEAALAVLPGAEGEGMDRLISASLTQRSDLKRDLKMDWTAK